MKTLARNGLTHRASKDYNLQINEGERTPSLGSFNDFFPFYLISCLSGYGWISISCFSFERDPIDFKAYFCRILHGNYIHNL